ncbi:ATP-binding protein [Puniceicoccaceae bacterium K14]|nr:ATP-binding protein [Puniceicoccaceae bacterium K14]
MFGDNDVNELIARIEELELPVFTFRKGSQILEIDQPNDALYIILNGEAQLYRKNEDDDLVVVDTLKRGSFLGLISFWTKQPSFSSSVASEDLDCIRVDRRAFDRLFEQDRVFSKAMQSLFIDNLTSRYRRLVNLNLKVDKLTRDLEIERNDLRQAIEDLERTRLKLVNKEKLATMGQLLAGIAHEINNPASALLKSVESLMSQFPELFHGKESIVESQDNYELLRLGMESHLMDSATQRERMRFLENAYPHLKRSLIRRLSQVDDLGIPLLESSIIAANKKAENIDTLTSRIRFYEIGIYLRGINLSLERIVRLVKSLKNYGRPDSGSRETVDLRNCVHDTVTVLNNRLKHYDFSLEMPPTPEVSCYPGEVNQVLTNLIVNACDATEEGGAIRIACKQVKGGVSIIVADEGAGIPEHLIDKIFEANVTTKNSGGNFGLGLGLAISREIAQKHDGKLSVKSKLGKGSVFDFWLPL